MPFISVGLQIKRCKMSITETESNITLTKQCYETIAEEIYSAISKIYRDIHTMKLATMGMVLTMNQEQSRGDQLLGFDQAREKNVISVAEFCIGLSV